MTLPPKLATPLGLALGVALGLLRATAPTPAHGQALHCPRPALALVAQTVGRWRVAWRWGWGVEDDSTVVQRASATSPNGGADWVLVQRASYRR
jgi:hypothetical protein